MITKRTLEQWRRDALNTTDLSDQSKPLVDILSLNNIEMKLRILRLTAELLDQHLMKR